MCLFGFFVGAFLKNQTHGLDYTIFTFLTRRTKDMQMDITGGKKIKFINIFQ